MEPIPLVRKVALAPALDYLATEGIPVGRHLRRAKLSPVEPATCEQLIPLHQLCEFLRSVSRAEGLDGLGFHIAGQHGVESLGTYGRTGSYAL